MTAQRRVLTGPPVADLDDYLSRGGGQGLHAAVQLRSGAAIIDVIEASGLRGRGGAGFPAGLKLRSIADVIALASPAPVVINAAEGEPGTFKDRTIIRHNPYELIEGACIAACALGTTEVIIAVKSSFTQEILRLNAAISQLTDADITNGFAIRLVEGPSEYLFGEETALLEVIEGRPPFPRIQPPYRRGLHSDRPDAAWSDTAAVFVSNVETFANLPGILRNGSEWFREFGTEQSPGTIVCTVTGDTVHDGVGEVALGATVREVIDQIGGGMPEERSVAAVLLGVSNNPIGTDLLDTPITYEDMAAVGSGVGSATFIVVDDTRSLRSVAAEVSRFLSVESCGQCEPCKRDGLAISDALHRGADPSPSPVAGLLATVANGARCALAGQQQRVIGRLLELADSARGADDAAPPFHIAPLVDIVQGRARLDLTQLDKRADWTYAGEEPDSNKTPVDRLASHPVSVHTHRVVESDEATEDLRDPVSLATPDAFAALRGIEDRLEEALEGLRRAPFGERRSAMVDLRLAFERHQRVTERLVYPLTRARLGQQGDDIAWYPQHHEQHAARLLRRLDTGSLYLSERLVDEVCCDIHASIIELQRRVLPAIDQSLISDEHEARVVQAGVEGLLTP